MTPYLEQPFVLIISGIGLLLVISLSSWFMLKSLKLKDEMEKHAFGRGIGLIVLCLFLLVKLIIQMVSVFSN